MSKFAVLDDDSEYESDIMSDVEDNERQVYNFDLIIARKGETRLPQQTLRMLNKLDRIISSDKFIKLPVFKKKELTKRDNKKDNKSINSVNSFKPVVKRHVIQKKTELDKLINRFRLSLNKITDDTYLDMRDDMFDCLDDMMKDYNEDYLKRVVSYIFETASCNRFYVDTYAKIYGEIYDNYEKLREMFIMCVNDIEILKSVRTADSEKNYDLFCEINLENEKRRSLMTFILKLCENGYIKNDFICDITNNLIHVFKTNVDVEGTSLICEEVSELLFIIVDNCSFKLPGNILNDLDDMTEMNPKKHVSLTNKSVFKLMDISDKI